MTYDFQLLVPLRGEKAQALLNWLQRVVQGTHANAEWNLPSGDLTPAELCAWLGESAATGRLRLLPTSSSAMLLEWSGELADQRFYGDFMPLLEWLAEASDAEGWVGMFHVRSLQHPSLVYFAAGRPYVLQVTGTPLEMASGEPMPELEISVEEDAGDDLEDDSDKMVADSGDDLDEADIETPQHGAASHATASTVDAVADSVDDELHDDDVARDVGDA